MQSGQRSMAIDPKARASGNPREDARMLAAIARVAPGAELRQGIDDIIRSRMAKAADEMSHWAEYDYVVINKDIDQAFAEVRAILAAERLKRERQTGLSAFVRGLQAEL